MDPPLGSPDAVIRGEAGSTSCSRSAPAVGPVVGRPTIRDGYVWVGAHDSLDSGDSINGGAVAIPLDPAEMAETALTTLQRELTSHECQEFLGTECP